jgi:hypothetical protein
VVGRVLPGGGGAITEVRLDVDGSDAPALQDIHRMERSSVGDLAVAGDVIFATTERAQNNVFVGKLAPGLNRLEAPLRPLAPDAESDASAVAWSDDGRVLVSTAVDGKHGLFAQGPGEPAVLASDERVPWAGRAGDAALGWRGVADASADCQLVRSSGGEWEPFFAAPPREGFQCETEVKCGDTGPCVAEEKGAASAVFSSVDRQTGERAVLKVVATARGWSIGPHGDVVAFASGQDSAVSYLSLPTRASRDALVSMEGAQSPTLIVQHLSFTSDGGHVVVSAIDVKRPEPYLLLVSDLEGHAHVLSSSTTSWFNDPVMDAKGLGLAVGEADFKLGLVLLTPR